MEAKFKNLEKVEDNITGFKGTVTAVCTYAKGSITYCVESMVDSAGKQGQTVWIDESRLGSVHN